MADLSDVNATLAALAAAAVYPSGTAQPSVAGIAVTIAPGWPQPAQLDQIVGAGNGYVSIYPLPGMDANTTRFAQDEWTDVVPPAQLTMTVSGYSTVTIGGTINPGEAAAIEWNRNYIAHAVTAADTLATVAAALAAQIPGASASGPVITLPADTFQIIARVSVPVPVLNEIARQERVFSITVWAPTPTARDKLAAAIDVALKRNVRITLPDDTTGLCRYRGTVETDELSKILIYRRSLNYSVEYGTVLTDQTNTVTGFQGSGVEFLI